MGERAEDRVCGLVRRAEGLLSFCVAAVSDAVGDGEGFSDRDLLTMRREVRVLQDVLFELGGALAEAYADVARLSDEELPGMWSVSDFTGGCES